VSRPVELNADEKSRVIQAIHQMSIDEDGLHEVLAWLFELRKALIDELQET
jgi:hypothetical protein